jgi:hypothetical protein
MYLIAAEAGPKPFVFLARTDIGSIDFSKTFLRTQLPLPKSAEQVTLELLTIRKLTEPPLEGLATFTVMSIRRFPPITCTLLEEIFVIVGTPGTVVPAVLGEICARDPNRENKTSGSSSFLKYLMALAPFT